MSAISGLNVTTLVRSTQTTAQQQCFLYCIVGAATTGCSTSPWQAQCACHNARSACTLSKGTAFLPLSRMLVRVKERKCFQIPVTTPTFDRFKGFLWQQIYDAINSHSEVIRLLLVRVLQGPFKEFEGCTIRSAFNLIVFVIRHFCVRS